jgi:hypothetical protein
MKSIYASKQGENEALTLKLQSQDLARCNVPLKAWILPALAPALGFYPAQPDKRRCVASYAITSRTGAI